MNTGPRVNSGFDLALTELPDSFVIEIGSEAGSNALEGVDWQPASAFDLGRVSQITQRTERQIQRQVTTSDLPQLLYDRIDHPYWDNIAARCLSCANCTLVCPTCFCSTVEDHSDLTGTKPGERGYGIHVSFSTSHMCTGETAARPPNRDSANG